MSPAPEVAAVTRPATAAPPLAPSAGLAAPGRTRRLAVRVRGTVPRAAWRISRTGRPGLVGLALLLAAGLFLLSTHRQVAAEVEALRAEVSAAQGRLHTAAADRVASPPAAARALPGRDEVPAILRQVFDEAARAHLAVDTARYEVAAATAGDVVRHQLTFPVTGPYPRVRAFIDATLAAMPAVGLRELAIERKSIADGNVEAQIRMTVYTRSAP